jgi:hypothetical protein
MAAIVSIATRDVVQPSQQSLTINVLALVLRDEGVGVSRHLERYGSLLFASVPAFALGAVELTFSDCSAQIPLFSAFACVSAARRFSLFFASSAPSRLSPDQPQRQKRCRSERHLPDSLVSLSNAVPHFDPTGRNDQGRDVLRGLTRPGRSDEQRSKLAVLRLAPSADRRASKRGNGRCV